MATTKAKVKQNHSSTTSIKLFQAIKPQTDSDSDDTDNDNKLPKTSPLRMTTKKKLIQDNIVVCKKLEKVKKIYANLAMS